MQKPLTTDVRAAHSLVTRFRVAYELGLPLSNLPRNSARFEETPCSRCYSIFHRLGATPCSQRSGEGPQFADEAFWERTTPEVTAWILDGGMNI